MDLKSEIKNVMLSSLKNPSDIKIGIEIENIIYNDKNDVDKLISSVKKALEVFG